MAGISPTGVKSHAPFTAEGANIANDVYKPGDGPRRVPIGLVNDPLDGCDPAGFPRNLLFELRPFQIVQTPNQLLLLYQYQKVWRVIWTDGRELPKDPDPQWYGYSVGKWEDDYTFVAETVGMDERTWLDNAGDPHSSEMRVEERYHRVDHDTMELTVKIDDPKIYTEPWLARDKLRLKLLPRRTDIDGNDLRAQRGGTIQKDDGQSSFQVALRSQISHNECDSQNRDDPFQMGIRVLWRRRPAGVFVRGGGEQKNCRRDADATPQRLPSFMRPQLPKSK